MTLSIDSALGLHPRALETLSRRLELIGANLANADTPGYKARDVDFRAALAAADGGALQRTDARHMSTGAPGIGGPAGEDAVRYRTSVQPSLDGNTVDPHVEKAAFAEASVRYESTLSFLGKRISGLKAAMRVE